MSRKHLGAVLCAAILTLGVGGLAQAQIISVNNSTGQVAQLGANVTPQAGETACTMDPTLAAQVASNQPNGGLAVQQFSPTPCTGTIVATPAPATPTPTATPPANPTIAVGAAAGTGATFSLANGSNLQRGAILVTAGTSPSLGTVLSITFPGGAPYVQIQPIGDNAAASGTYLRGLTSTVATVGVRAVMTAGQIYTIGYLLVS